MGFEWLFRLILEPRRLWKRYIQTNTRFIVELIMSFFKKIRKINMNIFVAGHNGMVKVNSARKLLKEKVNI